MNFKLDWCLRKFDELSNDELYELLRLRSEVFVLEQKCNFMDMDNKDQECYHLLGRKNNQLIAYTRILPSGVSYDFPSIGRIVVSADGRGMGFGVELMDVAVTTVERLFGKTAIRIGAQLYLEKFYGSFGFVKSSNMYLEDGIEHIEMTRIVA